MAIQHRRGNYADFDKSKMVAGEFAVVLQNDPETSDGKSVYIAFNSGSAKRLMTKEDLQEGIEAATQEVVDAITEATAQDVEDAQTAATAAAESASEAASVIPELNQENAVAGTALQLMSSNYTSDSTPYLYRTTGGGVAVGTRELDEVVGGSVGWNQLFRTDGMEQIRYGVTITTTESSVTFNGTATATVYIGVAYSSRPANRVFYIVLSGAKSNNVWLYNDSKGVTLYGNGRTISKSTDAASFYIRLTNGETYNETITAQIFDLTAMFGSTIADYIYSLETATAGAGVAKLKEWGFFGEDYYAYDAGSLQSVSVSAHIMRDADDNVVGNYPLDDSLTLRGIPKLSNNKLYYDGDVYQSDGTVNRRYGIVDLGTLEYGYNTSAKRWEASVSGMLATTGRSANVIASKYSADTSATAGDSGKIFIYNGSVFIYDSDGNTTPSGMLVYPLATPTTEQADPYASVQICAEGGTEEYVTTGIVPVGHNTKYPANLRERLDAIPDLPTTAGTYRLSVTIVSGKPVYEWVTT